MDRVVSALTHPWEYKLHKYWARKPYNVLSELVAEITPPCGVVVDPFCGSGVLLREASLLGRKSIGFDVNPIAVLISRVTNEPPDAAAFSECLSPILEAVNLVAMAAYGTAEKGSNLRYVVHEVVVRCDCGLDLGATRAIKVGKSYLCPDCKTRLRINASTMTSTRAIDVAWERNTAAPIESPDLKQQTELSRQNLCVNTKYFDGPLIENPRTLAHQGMMVSDLFSIRNWSILNYCAEVIWSLEESSVRDAALLLLTASAAQCSRLIAHRGNLTGGGPAWTVPGFWVPPVHLETNPAVHLRARAAKFERGLKLLVRKSDQSAVRVELKDAASGLRDLASSGEKADLIFMDPPYGDSVPYVEFSAIWNAFLGKSPDPSTDMAVSDRRHTPSRWADYARRMDEVVEAAAGVLAPKGKLLFTFNNNDWRAWSALLSALQRSQLYCDAVWYQIPAVVPSKAQFSPRGSYISDIYAVFQSGQLANPASVESVIRSLQACAEFRCGSVPRSVARRVLAISWMKNNLPPEGIVNAEKLLDELFQTRGEVLWWRGQLEVRNDNLESVVVDLANREITDSGHPWREFYMKVASQMVEYGVPDPWEVRQYWGDVEIKGKMCVRSSAKAIQLTMSA